MNCESTGATSLFCAAAIPERSGLNPKLFHRVRRFQRVLIQVHCLPEPAWEQLALEDGYFDQSHLIRDFLAFSGFSPADYLRRFKELHKKGLDLKFNHLPVSE
jgi:AraC-like DNA-binding protein